MDSQARVSRVLFFI